MTEAGWAARALTDADFLVREVALASSRVGAGAIGFGVIRGAGGGVRAIALAQAGALVRGGPDGGDALRSFQFDPDDLPVAQRDVWFDPLGAGLVPRAVARRAPVASHMKALGVHRAIRFSVCVGRRLVAAIGHGYAMGQPPTAAGRRALDAIARDLAPVLRAHALLAEAVAAPAAAPPVALTARQLQIARRAALGLGNAQIAAQLRLAPATIKTVLERLYRATGTRGRVGLARWLATHESR